MARYRSRVRIRNSIFVLDVKIYEYARQNVFNNFIVGVPGFALHAGTQLIITFMLLTSALLCIYLP